MLNKHSQSTLAVFGLNTQVPEQMKLAPLLFSWIRCIIPNFVRTKNMSIQDLIVMCNREITWYELKLRLASSPAERRDWEIHLRDAQLKLQLHLSM